MNQKTLSSPLEFHGIGLHTGQDVQLTCKPAPVGFGIKFVRTDITPHVVIPALVKNVNSTFRSTVLSSRDTEVHTVEHLLSALMGMGITNAEIEVNGSEIPILEGSAYLYVQAIRESGIEDQDEEVEVIRFDNTLYFKDEISGAEYFYEPSETTDFNCIIEYNSKVGRQVARWTPDVDYGEHISKARTFVFVHELEELYRKGIIKGGRLDNAIVFSHHDFPPKKIKELAKAFNVEEKLNEDDGILNGLSLLYPNEPARHKLLDLIGDLSLLGAPIQGKIVATRPGHTGNVAFAKFLRAILQKNKKLKGKPKYDTNITPLLNVEQIQEMLPHRYPFLMVDKIIEQTDSLVVGIKNVTINEGIFTGHFPGNSVFPGVLQMEALAQVGGILALSTVDDPKNYNTYFLKMDNVKFKKLVKPGDTLILKMELLSPIRRGIVHMQGTTYVGDAIVSEGELTAQISRKA